MHFLNEWLLTSYLCIIGSVKKDNFLEHFQGTIFIYFLFAPSKSWCFSRHLIWSCFISISGGIILRSPDDDADVCGRRRRRLATLDRMLSRDPSRSKGCGRAGVDDGSVRAVPCLLTRKGRHNPLIPVLENSGVCYYAPVALFVIGWL